MYLLKAQKVSKSSTIIIYDTNYLFLYKHIENAS